MWREGVFEGRWWQAKVYDHGSMFGSNNGRVSKLVVCAGSTWNREKIIYNYDRGLDVDQAPEGLVDRLLAQITGGTL